MDNRLLYDNWTLEEVAWLMIEGPSPESTTEVVIDTTAQKHRLDKVPTFFVQLTALLQTLTDIVIRDSLMVDNRYTSGWDFSDSPLRSLTTASLIDPHPFSKAESELDGPRKAIVHELCITASLRAIQKQNETWWKRYQRPKNPYFSTVLWGGAGMLARSHVFETPYTAHPLRQRLIKATALINPKPDPVAQVLDIIQTERTRLFQQIGSNSIRTYGTFSLPPIALEVIMNSNSVEELIPVAIQLRDKYSKLRKWLRSYEVAFNSEDSRKLLKHQKKLNSVAKSLNRHFKPDSGGSTNLSFGVSWLRVSRSFNPLDRFANAFGVRARLANLMLASDGENGLKKLLSLFEEKNTRLGRDIYRRFMVQHSKEPS